jgi:hypothetical protein
MGNDIITTMQLQEMISDFSDDNMQEIDNYTSKIYTGSLDDVEAFDLEILVSSLFNTNMWLKKNSSDIISLDELRERIECFRRILTNEMMLKAKAKFEVSGLYALSKERSGLFVDRLYYALQKNGYEIPEPDSYVRRIDAFDIYDQTMDKAFSEGKNIIGKLLDDKQIKKDSVLCKFNLLTGRVRDDWTSVDYFKAVLSNEKCLGNLDKFYDSAIRLSKGEEKSKSL